MNKRGLLGGGPGGGPRQPLSFLLGTILLVFGLIPLLASFNVIGFTIPYSPAGVILWVLAAVGGLILLWDAISEQMPTGIESKLRMLSLVGAVILLAFGIIPILYFFGVIGFNLPDLAAIIINVLFTVNGLLLLYGGTKQF